MAERGLIGVIDAISKVDPEAVKELTPHDLLLLEHGFQDEDHQSVTTVSPEELTASADAVYAASVAGDASALHLIHLRAYLEVEDDNLVIEAQDDFMGQINPEELDSLFASIDSSLETAGLLQPIDNTDI